MALQTLLHFAHITFKQNRMMGGEVYHVFFIAVLGILHRGSTTVIRFWCKLLEQRFPTLGEMVTL